MGHGRPCRLHVKEYEFPVFLVQCSTLTGPVQLPECLKEDKKRKGTAELRINPVQF